MEKVMQDYIENKLLELVASFQQYGAALGTSIAYCATFFYQADVFGSLYEKKIQFYIPTKNELVEVKNKIRKIWKRN